MKCKSCSLIALLCWVSTLQSEVAEASVFWVFECKIWELVSGDPFWRGHLVCSGLGWAQESAWWWQLGNLGYSATLRSQLIQEHRQSQGNQCICQRSINAGCNWGTQLPAGRFLAFLTRWPENAYISSPENQASAENQELHHPAENCFIHGLFSGFVGFVRLLIFVFIETAKSIISASWRRYAWSLYCEKKGKLKGRKKLRRKKENRDKDISARDAVIVQCQHNGVLTII